MPLSEEFLADCLYGPEGILLDEVLLVDKAQSLVRVRMPTRDDLPITAAQRVDPIKHPRHVSGGLMIHMTGVAAFVHFFYVLELRHSLGWTGYGVRIHQARFHALARIGAPIEIECRATKVRNLAGKMLARYDFKFTQEGQLVYEGDQTAMWSKLDTVEGDALP